MEIDYGKIYGQWSYSRPEIDTKKMAVVVIDMQPMFIQAEGGLDELVIGGGSCDRTYFPTRCKELVIPNIRRILDAARAANVPVCHVVTYSEKKDLSDLNHWMTAWVRKVEKKLGKEFYRQWTPGADICEELRPVGDEIVYVKKTGSAFVSSILPYHLRNMGIESLVFGGVNTNGCAFSSAVVAFEMGWNSILVGDATACWAPELQELFEKHIFPRSYGPVMTTQEVVSLLSGKS